MADPSKRRASDAVCRLVADAFIEWANIAEPPEGPNRVRCWVEMVQPALTAYRRETAPLRSKAEVDAERLLNLDAWKAGAIDGRTLMDRDEKLASEETAPEAEPNAITDHDADTREPEPCGCEQAEALKARLERCRTILRAMQSGEVSGQAGALALARELS